MSAPAGLHVVEHPGRDPMVVLVHGSLDRAASFTRVTRRLADLHVVAYDRRGYQRSRPAGSPPVALEGHVADLVALVGSGPAVVVGHSYGGDVAIGAALAAPGAVVGVLAYEPPLAWKQWWPTRRQGPAADPAHFARSFFSRMVGEEAWEGLGQRMRAELEADGPALMAELTALRQGGAPFDPSLMAVPTLVGRGEVSVPHHRRAVAELAEEIPGAELAEIRGASHGAHLRHPGAFAELVRRLLERVAAGG